MLIDVPSIFRDIAYPPEAIDDNSTIVFIVVFAVILVGVTVFLIYKRNKKNAKSK